jgi:HEAT repeat protein
VRTVFALTPLTLILSSVLLVFSGHASSFREQITQRGLTPLQLEIEKQQQRLSSAEIEERRDALMRLGGLHRPEASLAALPGLKDPVPIVRATAASVILSLPPSESVEALSPLLRDKEEFVRKEAAYALGATHSRAAVPLLIERLNRDKKDSVRGAAAVALGQIANESAVVPLVQILSQGVKQIGKRGKGNPLVLRAAARSLGQIGSRAAVPVLVSVVIDEGVPNDIRRESAQALSVIGDPSAEPALRSVLMARDPYLSRIASEALLKIAPGSKPESHKKAQEAQIKLIP